MGTLARSYRDYFDKLSCRSLHPCFLLNMRLLKHPPLKKKHELVRNIGAEGVDYLVD